MKKVVVCICVFLLFYGKYEYVDIKKYTSDTKEIEIKGAVKNPGVYEVSIHANNEEVIEKAGGLREDGDDSRVNKTQDLPNKSVLIIHEKTKSKLISINTGTLEELHSLKGIGLSVAKRIMEYREKATFYTLEDLKKVKGIGNKLYEKIKDSIAL